jgi:energy-coupling factor transporter transmembrane protein EcfT
MALKSRATPWSYRKADTPLHRLPAGFKLAFLLLLSLASFYPGTGTQTLAILGCVAFVLTVLSFVAGAGPLSLLRGSGPLLLTVPAAFLFRAVEINPPGVNMDGLAETLVFCGRIATAFGAGSLLFSVTTAGEIRKSLARAERLLRVERLKLSLSVSLMLGFLKGFFEVWEDLLLAWKSRGGRGAFSGLSALLPIAIERMMMKALETSCAMEARGATLGFGED